MNDLLDKIAALIEEHEDANDAIVECTIHNKCFLKPSEHKWDGNKFVVAPPPIPKRKKR